MLGTGGTADLTITHNMHGGTVIAVSNITAPFQRNTGEDVHNSAGGTNVVVERGVPVSDYLTVTVAEGAASGAGTVFVTYLETP